MQGHGVPGKMSSSRRTVLHLARVVQRAPETDRFSRAAVRDRAVVDPEASRLDVLGAAVGFGRGEPRLHSKLAPSQSLALCTPRRPNMGSARVDNRKGVAVEHGRGDDLTNIIGRLLRAGSQILADDDMLLRTLSNS